MRRCAALVKYQAPLNPPPYSGFGLLLQACATSFTAYLTPAMTLILTSTAFQHRGEIPGRHTCDGEDISPQLVWTGVPVGTQSLVLIVDDPDAPDPAAPKMTWVHWILYNLPPDARDLPEGMAVSRLPSGTLQGLNDWGRPGYGGPCPPVGTHRYFHKLFALDVRLPDLGLPAKAALEKAMQGHVLAQGELMGLYQRASPVS